MRISNLAKSFGSQPALQDVSFDLKHGELLALLGPNGAGKTSLIRCVSGQLTPDKGSITLAGKPLLRKSDRQSLGFVPQELAIYPDLTAIENLRVFGRFHGLRRGRLEDAVEWALDWTGLAARGNDLTRTFSGGMRRRVNIACGVLHQPKVLLLDEPTVGVDPQSRELIFAMLLELKERGTSILLTTHHLDEAEQRSDRIVVIDHGRIIAEGTLDELIANTVGSSRHVRIRTDRVNHSVQCGRWDSELPLLHAAVDDVAAELPDLLGALDAESVSVEDVEVRSPSLHTVFIHLTGRELRE